mmetsp:Transcript_2527/g.5350  ORF Transcript_2527/g.5350 Transcript_2527/m.5350 type:complete len:200 (+) Transcript_2527:322-921(+)
MVRELDRVPFIFSFDNGDHGAENLGIEREHPGLDVCEHSWREECVSGFPVGTWHVGSANEELRPCCLRVQDLLRDVLPRFFVDKGAKVYTVTALRDPFQHLLLESGLHAPFHNGTLRGATDLAAIDEAPSNYSLRRAVEVGVGEDEVRVRTAQLNHGLLEQSAGLRCNRSPGSFGSCKCHAAYLVMLQDLVDLRHIDDQ